MRTFETPRLSMRPLCPDDREFYCSCYSDPVLMRHIGVPLSREAALRSFAAALKIASVLPIRRYTWVMQDKVSKSVVGLLAMFCDDSRPNPVSAELGNIMLAKFQNKGFTIEVLSRLIDIAFRDIRLETLQAKHQVQNNAAVRVMRKLCFSRRAMMPSDIDNAVWVMTRTDWQARCIANSPG